MSFARQEYWSGLSFSSPGDLHDSGVELKSPALQVDSLPLSHWGSPEMNVRNLKPVKTRLERQTCNYAHTKANILGLFAFFDFLGHQIYWYDELKFNY